MGPRQGQWHLRLESGHATPACLTHCLRRGNSWSLPAPPAAHAPSILSSALLPSCPLQRAHHHLQRRVRQGHGQHARRPQARRAFRAWRKPHARPRLLRRAGFAQFCCQHPLQGGHGWREQHVSAACRSGWLQAAGRIGRGWPEISPPANTHTHTHRHLPACAAALPARHPCPQLCPLLLPPHTPAPAAASPSSPPPWARPPRPGSTTWCPSWTDTPARVSRPAVHGTAAPRGHHLQLPPRRAPDGSMVVSPGPHCGASSRGGLPCEGGSGSSSRSQVCSLAYSKVGSTCRGLPAGGHHINVNVLQRETLLDAMEHPEK